MSLTRLHLVNLYAAKCYEQGRFSLLNDHIPSIPDFCDIWNSRTSDNQQLASDIASLLQYVDISTHYDLEHASTLIETILQSTSSEKIIETLLTSWTNVTGSFDLFMTSIAPLLTQNVTKLNEGDQKPLLKKFAVVLLFIINKCSSLNHLLLLLSTDFGDAQNVDWNLTLSIDQVFNGATVGSVPMIIAKCLQSNDDDVRSMAFHLTTSLSIGSPTVATRMLDILTTGLFYEAPSNRIIVASCLADICTYHKLSSPVMNYLMPLINYPCKKVSSICAITVSRLLLEDCFGLEVECVIFELVSYVKSSSDVGTVRFIDNSLKTYGLNKTLHQQELVNTVIWYILNSIAEKKILINDQELIVNSGATDTINYLMKLIHHDFFEAIAVGVIENIKEGLDVSLERNSLYQVLGIESEERVEAMEEDGELLIS
ncbi:hypothetical protein GEMRC1_000579 [Eukaryota sp. GEM-RC1]